MNTMCWKLCLFSMLLSLLLPAIELLSPSEGATIQLLRADWKAQIAERGARRPVPETEWGLEDRLDRPEPVVFSWQGDTDREYTLELARDAKFQEPVKRVAVKGTTASLLNLETGRVYYWRVHDGETMSAARSFTTSEETPRFLAVPGGVPANVRDAGGKMTTDGRRTRQGLVFRGSQMNMGFYMIKPEGVKFMREELKIRTDLDMRYPKQTAAFKSSPLGDDVQWLLRPVNAYDSFTAEQNDLFRDTIRVFAEPANYPIYLHCSGGSDRTGEIVFLLDMLLDVEEEQALLDYESSSLAYYPRPRKTPYFQRWLKTIQSMSPPGTMRAQQVVNYLKGLGITDDEIAAIREMMLE